MTTPNVDQPPVRLMHTVEDAADRLRISRTRMYQLIKAGDVSSVRIGRLRRIPDEALITYLRDLTA